MSKITTSELNELHEAATRANSIAPGGWADDSNEQDGYDYRQVVADVGTICDTTNAHHGFSPSDRLHLLEHVALCDPPTVLALVALARKGLAVEEKLPAVTLPSRVDLQLWRSHKIVKAGKIKDIFALRDPVELLVENAQGYDVSIHVPLSVFARWMPGHGDYFVIYDDSWMSASPAKAFEDGYTKITE